MRPWKTMVVNKGSQHHPHNLWFITQLHSLDQIKYEANTNDGHIE
jgi:hypothetical protein